MRYPTTAASASGGGDSNGNKSFKPSSLSSPPAAGQHSTKRTAKTRNQNHIFGESYDPNEKSFHERKVIDKSAGKQSPTTSPATFISQASR
jgi:hypothetical protein